MANFDKFANTVDTLLGPLGCLQKANKYMCIDFATQKTSPSGIVVCLVQPVSSYPAALFGTFLILSVFKPIFAVDFFRENVYSPFVYSSI